MENTAFDFYRLVTRKEEAAFHEEVEGSGLIEHLELCRRAFRRGAKGLRVRDYPARFGAMSINMARRWYCLVRKYRPERIVETGVCNGQSTAFLLLAVERNGTGALTSIDYPEYAGARERADVWAGKRGAAVPADRQPGWVVPDRLRAHWTLLLGKSQELLPGVLEGCREIDLFLHDSEHSYECMSFEYRTAFPHIRPGGFLGSDDVNWNTAFDDFVREHGLTAHRIGKKTAVALI